MEVFKASLDDLESLTPLFDSYRQFCAQASAQQEARAFLRERLTRGDSVIFIAREQDRAIGFVQLYPSFSSSAMKRLWVLNDLFVDPSARKKSVGRALMEQAETFARETNARGLTLKAAIDNLPAQKLYEGLGWSRDQRFYSYDLRF